MLCLSTVNYLPVGDALEPPSLASVLGSALEDESAEAAALRDLSQVTG